MTVKNPALLPLFDELKQLAAPFAAYFAVRFDSPGRYELWSEVNIAPAGKTRHEPMFASLVVQKSYVGFYYMPIYADPELRSVIGPELLSTLHGKSCFYIKSLTPVLSAQIVSALDKGLELYKSNSSV